MYMHVFYMSYILYTSTYMHIELLNYRHQHIKISFNLQILENVTFFYIKNSHIRVISFYINCNKPIEIVIFIYGSSIHLTDIA